MRFPIAAIEPGRNERFCKLVPMLSISVVLCLAILPKAVAEEESDWLLMAWDPPADVRDIGSYPYPLHPERAHIDILAFLVKVNETTFSLRLELNGQVSNNSNVEYSIGVCEIEHASHDSSVIWTYGVSARYSNQNATFNGTEIAFAIEDRSIVFQIPKTLMEAEGCLKNGGRIDFEWLTVAHEHDYYS
jgi:hypothetical protein